MQGWIKLHRKIMDNPIWNDPNYLKLWMYCLFKASHKEHEILVGNQMVKLEPGQFVTGRKSLFEDMNKGVKSDQKLSEKTWERYLKNLEKWQMLTIKVTNKYSIVTIDKYRFYQYDEVAIDQVIDQQLTNKCPTSDQQLTTNKNVKNVKNEKEELKDILSSSIPYKEIVDYLNEKCGTKYKPTTSKTKQLIQARWNEKFTLEDFKTVIDIKAAEWLGDKEMSKYLRPETLFGSKFESYLNQNKHGFNKPSNSIDAEEVAAFNQWISEGGDPDEFVYKP